MSLGFEWRINGDDNRNAHVDVTFRKKGDTNWRNGLPLRREQHELIGEPPLGQPAEVVAARKQALPRRRGHRAALSVV